MSRTMQPAVAAADPTSSRDVARARIAVSTVFFLSGTASATWAVRIPVVRERLALEASALGIALLGVAVGALLAMPFTGTLVARFGSRAVTRAGAVLLAGTLLLPSRASSVIGLTLALVALGAATGTLNVAMNAQAASVERAAGRPMMSSFHALFSVGGLAGAAFGGALVSRGVSTSTHLTVIAIVVATVATGSTSRMLSTASDGAPGHARDHAHAHAPDPTTSPGISRALVTLGIVAACGSFGEGAMADWSAVYLRDVTHAGPGLAAGGYAAFSLTMAVGRAVGDALTTRFGPARLVRGGGALAAAGLSTALAVGTPWAAVSGFGLVGAGLSVVFPSVLAAASRVAGTAPSRAIAAVSTVGYAGFLAGPPLIGIVAHVATLGVGLALVAVTATGIAVLASAVGTPVRPMPAGRARRPALRAAA